MTINSKSLVIILVTTAANVLGQRTITRGPAPSGGPEDIDDEDLYCNDPYAKLGFNAL